MEQILALVVNNPDAPVIIILIVWLVFQMRKIKTQMALMQNDIRHIMKTIYNPGCKNCESHDHRHQNENVKGRIG